MKSDTEDNALYAQATTTTGPPNSPTSQNDFFASRPTSPASVVTAVQPPNASRLKRYIITIYFLFVTFSIALLACVGCVCVRLVWLMRGVRMRCSGFSSPHKRESLERTHEEVRGAVVDFAVRCVMVCCCWAFQVRVVGPGGVPRERVSQKEWLQWLREHSTEHKKGYLRCSLPRDARGNVKLPPGCLIMSNHMSNIDGFCLKTAVYGTKSKAIIKGDVVRVPIVGWLVKLSGEPLVHFTKSKGGWGTERKEELISRCSQIVERGFPLIVYPEGVRRVFGRMAPLRHGMFNFAMQHSFPILVAATYGSQQVWPVRQALLDEGVVYMAFSDEIIIARPTDTAEHLAQCVRSKMLALLTENVPAYSAQAEEPPIESVEEYYRLASQNPA